MHLASNTWRICWAALCSVVLACGGENQQQLAEPNSDLEWWFDGHGRQWNRWDCSNGWICRLRQSSGRV